MTTHTNQDEDEGADFERKASNLDAKRKYETNYNYSKNKEHGEIKSLETTSDTSNQQLPDENNSSWWQTNHKSCENES